MLTRSGSKTSKPADLKKIKTGTIKEWKVMKTSREKINKKKGQRNLRKRKERRKGKKNKKILKFRAEKINFVFIDETQNDC